MNSFYNSKRGITEITSFVLITLLIIVSSTTAYFFSEDVIGNNLSEKDLTNVGRDIRIILRKIEKNSNFDESSFVYNFDFTKGIFVFESNQMIYYSEKVFAGGSYCINEICYEDNGGYEKIHCNLSNSYQFYNNVTLNTGEYLLLFTNIKNESKMSVILK